MMIDGVFLGGENCVVVALGIDAGGVKQVLDFEAGSSESLETVRRLICRLEKRGVRSPAESPLFVVRDGSEAIKSAVAQMWLGALQQTCLVHLKRNISDRLRQRDRGESQLLFRRLRKAEGKAPGEEAYEDSREFVAERNATAGLILVERREEALTLHRLGVPSTLNVTFLSTCVIEPERSEDSLANDSLPRQNIVRNWREQTGNVKRCSVRGDMIQCWAASGLQWAKVGFRRIWLHEDLASLTAALQERGHSLAASIGASASSMRSSASAPIEAASEELTYNHQSTTLTT